MMAPRSGSLVEQLSSTADDVEAKLRAVRSLRNEIIGSQYKKQCYLELGAVPRVAHILAIQGEKKLTIQAAATLGSFAYRNEAGVMAIVESGGIEYLLKTLSSEDEKVVEAGVRALKMIFQSESSPRYKVFASPAFDRLVELLSNPKKTFAEDAATIFSKCCDAKQNQDKLMAAGALTGLARLLLTQTPNRQVAALKALGPMSYQNVDVCEAMFSIAGVKNALLGFVRDKNSSVRLMACSILTNINKTLPPTSKSPITFREQKHILQVLVALLTDPIVVEENVPAILATLTEDRKDLQRAAYEVDAAKKLCTFLSDARKDTPAGFMVGVLRALATISQNVPNCRKQVVDCQAVNAIVSCLKARDGDVRAAAAFCIRKMTATVDDLNYEWVTASIQPIIDLLLDDSVAVKVEACAALCNLVYENNQAKTACIQRCLPLLVDFSRGSDSRMVYHAACAFRNLTHKLAGDSHTQVLDSFSWSYAKGLLQHHHPVVQTSALVFIQNVCSSGSERIQAIMDWSDDELLQVVSSKLATIDAHPPDLISAALHVVSNISTGAADHQTAVMESAIPSQLLSCLKDKRSETTRSETIRGTAAWCVINLIWKDELPHAGSGEDGARQRAEALREVGIEEQLRQMQGDEELDVRERVRTALGYFAG